MPLQREERSWDHEQGPLCAARQARNLKQPPEAAGGGAAKDELARVVQDEPRLVAHRALGEVDAAEIDDERTLDAEERGSGNTSSHSRTRRSMTTGGWPQMRTRV